MEQSAMSRSPKQDTEQENNARDATKKAPVHRRSISGNLLAKISFLRPLEDTIQPRSNAEQTDGTISADGKISKPGNAMASALHEKKPRRRKGSLRKTALLGTGRLRMEGKDKRTSQLEPLIPVDQSAGSLGIELATSPDEIATPRPSLDCAPASTDSATTISPAQTDSGFSSKLSANDLTSDEHLPLASFARKQTFGDLSTTDDDDAMTYMRPLTSSLSLKKSSANSDSYFPIDSLGIPRHRSAARAKSPLATLSVEPNTPPEEWDYSNTEWWGWVVLVVTWVVFVVGMGSCLGVWSWAWDVGETPYAPPELEDDPTLPIVGYYPALIILTGVMAWVWVVVAWVGLKYFKHAKISGEDV